MNVFLKCVTVAAALGALATQAAGQSTDAPATDDCQVHALDGDGAAIADGAAGSTDPQSLTDVLAPCDGVLEPAPVGDQGMTVPPPAGGETPVIEPGELPEQPPQDE